MLMPDASCIPSLLYCLRSTCLLWTRFWTYYLGDLWTKHWSVEWARLSLNSLEAGYVNIIIKNCWYFCIIFSFPKILKVFEIDDVKAWKSVLISVTSYALGLLMISKAPWYLLPLAWAWTGTAATGVSSIYIFTICILLMNFHYGSFPPPHFLFSWYYHLYMLSNSYFFLSLFCKVLCYRTWLCSQSIFK